MPNTAIEPYVKLAQSNIASLTDFWMSPDVLWAPMGGLQRAFAGAAGGASPAPSASTEAVSRLFKALMENYTRFVSELSQAGFAMWSEGQRQASSAAGDIVDAAASSTRRNSGS